MADSDLVIPSREEIRVGDVRYKAAISEAVFTRVAAQNNFINTYQVDSHRWALNGSYGVATGLNFYDGVTTFFFNSEITGVNFWNQSGVSGTTEFDVNWIDASGVDQGSIFTTTPKITATNQVSAFKNLVTNTEVNPTGTVLPTFAKTNFLEGESLYLKLNTAMISGFNCGLNLFYRPIN